MSLETLSGLGPKSAEQLRAAGIKSAKQLQELGAFNAYIRLWQHQGKKPNRNYLYALVAAVENRSWLEVAKHEREDLLMKIDAYEDIGLP